MRWISNSSTNLMRAFTHTNLYFKQFKQECFPINNFAVREPLFHFSFFSHCAQNKNKNMVY